MCLIVPKLPGENFQFHDLALLYCTATDGADERILHDTIFAREVQAGQSEEQGNMTTEILGYSKIYMTF